MIDLKNGQVVHARRGQRDRYPPLQSPLCHGSDPHGVLGGILALYPFDTVYIADLDAICGQGGHEGLLAELCQTWPRVCFWIDRGWPASDTLLQRLANVRPVIGTESLQAEALDTLESLPAGWVLSLDFSAGDRFLGPACLLDRMALWPQQLIVMSLARVGGGSGPDLDRLRALRAGDGQRQWFTAGGVRDAQDLLAIGRAGGSGALVASALHRGILDGATLTAIAAAGNGETAAERCADRGRK